MKVEITQGLGVAKEWLVDRPGSDVDVVAIEDVGGGFDKPVTMAAVMPLWKPFGGIYDIICASWRIGRGENEAIRQLVDIGFANGIAPQGDF